MSEPQAARPTQHVSEKALEDLDHNVIEPPPVPRRDIPEGAGKVVFVGAGPAISAGSGVTKPWASRGAMSSSPHITESRLRPGRPLAIEWYPGSM